MRSGKQMWCGFVSVLVAGIAWADGISGSVSSGGAALIHSHNDYARERPFWGAYEADADSIEADIHLVDGALLVAHDRERTDPAKTLQKLYLEPIREVMRKNGGRVRADGKPLQLLVDLKNGKPALDRLVEVIGTEGFRDCFDIRNNPSAVRLTISGDLSQVKDPLAYPDFVGFDGRPGQTFTAEQFKRVPLISQSARAYTQWKSGPMAEADKEKIRAAIDAARANGCRFRLWGFPDGAEAWALALELGLDYLNTDRPAEAAAFMKKRFSGGLRLTAPADRATVPTLSEGQKAYLAMPRKERVAFFADEAKRKEMKKLGYYPQPLTLAWEGIPAGTKATVSVYRLPERTCVFQAETEGTFARIDNLEIARSYAWHVEAAGESRAAQFTTEAIAPRLIRVPGVPNVRDLGGCVGLGGKRVRQGRVFRSAGLNDNAENVYLTKEELAASGRLPELDAEKKVLEAEQTRFEAFQKNPATFKLVPNTLSPTWTVFRPERELTAADEEELARLDTLP
ncbi:MAG: tyrosine-protein phosphatase, partial [Kiritimatiellae bacterium]|nr:tyrosine-protein phosphatase [Kiritimatiellia bacterium]